MLIPASGGLESRHSYALHAEIASGGMATIRLGRQVGPYGVARVVAIKQLHPQCAADQEFVAMFWDEVRMASRVSHPNVVPMLDVLSAEGEIMLVMEYVHGESVAYLLKRAGAVMPAEIASTIAVGVLHGLHAAHEARSEGGDLLRLIHRDVTPQNVLIGIDGTPRVLDFGIAHAIGRVQMTKLGQIKGKLAYMAPEQLRGEGVDRRVDIYSTSVMLWEMLAGRRLFGARHENKVARMILHKPVPRPSELRAGVDPALDAIVMRGLQRDPRRRFATAREMAIALEERTRTVSATQLGDWVKLVWGVDLGARVRQIMEIEQGSASTGAASSSSSIGFDVSDWVPDETTRAEGSDGDEIGNAITVDAEAALSSTTAGAAGGAPPTRVASTFSSRRTLAKRTPVSKQTTRRAAERRPPYDEGAIALAFEHAPKGHAHLVLEARSSEWHEEPQAPEPLPQPVAGGSADVPLARTSSASSMPAAAMPTSGDQYDSDGGWTVIPAGATPVATSLPTPRSRQHLIAMSRRWAVPAAVGAALALSFSVGVRSFRSTGGGSDKRSAETAGVTDAAKTNGPVMPTPPPVRPILTMLTALPVKDPTISPGHDAGLPAPAREVPLPRLESHDSTPSSAVHLPQPLARTGKRVVPTRAGVRVLPSPSNRVRLRSAPIAGDTSPARAGRSSAPPSCDPPFVMDETGIKHFKLACL